MSGSHRRLLVMTRSLLFWLRTGELLGASACASVSLGNNTRCLRFAHRKTGWLMTLSKTHESSTLSVFVKNEVSIVRSLAFVPGTTFKDIDSVDKDIKGHAEGALSLMSLSAEKPGSADHAVTCCDNSRYHHLNLKSVSCPLSPSVCTSSLAAASIATGIICSPPTWPPRTALYR